MPCLNRTTPRAGFTLVEVVVAILLLTIALLALEGSAAVTLRDLADSKRETLAMHFAEDRREGSFGSICAASSGLGSANGVTATWTTLPTSSRSHVIERTTFQTRYGVRIQAYNAAGRCR